MIVFANNRPINVNPRFVTQKHKDIEKKLMLKCKNPLMRDKKECVIFWEEFDRYVKSIESMEYGIDNLHFDRFIDDKSMLFDVEDGSMYEI